MSEGMPTVFFGYPSRPAALREIVARAAKRLGETAGITPRTWESLSVGGRFVISEITKAIDTADLAVFEVTSLNQNVMFELGYAIGARKRVWLLYDPTDHFAERRWKQLRLLTTVGYAPYANSEHVRVAFLKEQPQLAADTIFDQAIVPALQQALFPSIFYLSSPHNSEAERDLRRRIQDEQRQGLSCQIDDATESAVQPLSWYAQQIYAANAVLIHLLSPERVGAEVHNARAALIGGLAHGMDRPLLMVAHEGYPAPIDYQDLLYVYRTANEAVSYVDRWLNRELASVHAQSRDTDVKKRRLHLATELRSLRLGEHVAENEVDILDEYFVETATFDQILEAKTMVYVGRKGTGKTANLMRASEILANDKRQLVCVVKPYGYEMDSVVRLMNRFAQADTQSYVVEALWKFLLLSEITLAAAAEIEARPFTPERKSPEAELLRYLEGEGNVLTYDFAVRLERAIEDLLKLPAGEGVEDERARITQALHDTHIEALRALLGRVLTKKTRVAVLVDNLDKPWDRGEDLDALATFLLGLLTAVVRLEHDFARSDSWRRPIPLTLAVLLRSDIFSRVVRAAREPDKIPFMRLVWDDPEVLLRVVEERFVAAKEGQAEPGELWSQYFTDQVGALPTKSYILSRILPRPRDLVYFCNAAITTAINRRHDRIESDDVLEAEKIYSQFAFEALLVEAESMGIPLETVLYYFAGQPPVIDRESVVRILEDADVPPDDRLQALENLRVLSFLGVETHNGQFAFSDDQREMQLSDVLAKRLEESRHAPYRFRIHPAFRAYLEIADEGDPVLSSV
ncbi:MAG: P-loop ATPase, Sll1717 family [Gaiellaceae bacterium]